MAGSGVKQFTLRIPGELYRDATRVAKARGTSLNALTRLGLEEITRQAAFEKLQAEFELLGKLGDNDVEYAITAFREVLGDE